MSVADQIIRGKMPDIEGYLAQGGAINDMDEYGFPFLTETAIADNVPAMKYLLTCNADVNKQDATGRTALHWAVDNNQEEQTSLLLEAGANPNIPNRAGQPPLVFPLLREQWKIKQLLYQYGASLSFAKDFINTKLIGHRFEIPGTVDIVNANGRFIELDYEGFFLEFSLATIQNSISRFSSHFSFRKLRLAYAEITDIIHAFFQASQLIHYQDMRARHERFDADVNAIFQSHLLILPVAYQGHAITFVRCGPFWAKCDRGENSLVEDSINIYWIGNSTALTTAFFKSLLYQKQTKEFVHQQVNQILGLQSIGKIPLSHQKSGNCSWANVEAAIPTAYVLMQLNREYRMKRGSLAPEQFQGMMQSGLYLYAEWLSWDQDRALEECIQGFYESDSLRKASKAAILGGILFHGCQYPVPEDMQRAEKMLKILLLKDYRYVLQSYLDVYCEKRLTVRGNNFLHILDDLGADIEYHATPVAKE